MIAKSDLFILVISASLLAVGIFRWQSNVSNLAQARVQQAPAAPITVPQSSTTVVQAISNNEVVQPAVTAITSLQTTSNSSPTVVLEQPTVTVQPIQTTTQITQPLYGIYTVVSGDYLSKIAVQYGTSVQALQDINGLSGTLIEVGQQLRYPLPAN